MPISITNKMGKRGGEILVNTATLGDQGNPQIVTLEGGGFVVVWEDGLRSGNGSHGVGGATGDSSSTAVKAQLFAANGARVGGEILLNTATVGSQYAPHAAALPGGGFVVAWQDDSSGIGGATGDSSGFAVKAQVFAAGGVPAGSEILVNTATGNDQATPVIAVLDGDDFVIAWYDKTGDSSGWAVKAQVFAANGVRIGGEILVNTATQGTQVNPQISALDGGGFVIAWEDLSQSVDGAAGDSSNWAVKAQVFAAGGVRVGGEFLVNTATQDYQLDPQIVTLDSGGFVVVWDDLSRSVGGATGDSSRWAVKAQVFTANGFPIGGEILVNTATAGAQSYAKVSALKGGDFVITWMDGSLGLAGFDGSLGVGGATGDFSSDAVKAQIFSGRGLRIGGEILVNTATGGNQDRQQVTALDGGGFVISWQDWSQGVGGAPGDSSLSAVKAQVFAADGARIGGEVLVNTATQNPQMLNNLGGLFWTTQIVALPGGGFTVVWQDKSLGIGGATGDFSGWAVKAQMFGLGGLSVVGDLGDLLLLGGDSDDVLTGFHDLSGLAGDDLLVGGPHGGVLDGGNGWDTVSYAGALRAVSADLAVGNASTGGGVAGGGMVTDTLLSIENIIGGAGGDALSGDARSNWLDGGPGNDVLNGRGGSNTLTGGPGADDFIIDARDFASAGGPPSSNTITDMGPQDRIVLSNLPAGIALDQDAISVTREAFDSGPAGGGTPNDVLDGVALKGSTAVVAILAINLPAPGFPISIKLANLGNVSFTLVSPSGGSAIGPGGSGEPYITLTSLQDTTGGDDHIIVGAGNDVVDGGTGLDTVAFSGNRSTYTITRQGDALQVNGTDGADILTAVERLEFADKGVAFDLDGSAGLTALTLGAVFGKAALSNAQYVKIGLGLFDSGMSHDEVMKLALQVKLGAAASNAAVVNLLYTNVMGTAPDAAALANFTSLLESGAMMQSSLGVLAANHAFNESSIGLVGLSDSGLEFLAG